MDVVTLRMPPEVLSPVRDVELDDQPPASAIAEAVGWGQRSEVQVSVSDFLERLEAVAERLRVWAAERADDEAAKLIVASYDRRGSLALSANVSVARIEQLISGVVDMRGVD